MAGAIIISVISDSRQVHATFSRTALIQQKSVNKNRLFLIYGYATIATCYLLW